MKIRLVNFLCYKDTTYDFGERGMVLLSGPSGSGKSSVCRGVFFALYGEGTRVQTYGQTSGCRVELWFQDLHVVRTKRPNRLLLNDTQEDQEAQAVLDARFGAMFRSTGYIQQNNLTSFILFSPSDKLAFLEKWLFADPTLAQIRAKSAAGVKTAASQVEQLQSELDRAQAVYSELTVGDPVDFPLHHPALTPVKLEAEGFAESALCARLIRNEEVRLHNAQLMEKKLNLSHAKELKQHQLQKETQMRLTSCLERQRGLVLEQGEIDHDLTLAPFDQAHFDQISHQLAVANSQRELQAKSAELATLCTQLQLQTDAEDAALKEKIAELRACMWVDYSEEDVTQTIQSLRDAIHDRTTITNLEAGLVSEEVLDPEAVRYLQDRLTQYQEQLEQLQIYTHCSQFELKCPGCDLELALAMGEKRCFLEHKRSETNTDTKTIQRLTREIDGLQSRIASGKQAYKTNSKLSKKILEIEERYEELPDLISLQSDLEQMQSYHQLEMQKETQLRLLETQVKNGVYSRHHNRLHDQVARLEMEVTNLQDVAGVETVLSNEEEALLREDFVVQNQNKLERSRLLARQAKCQQREAELRVEVCQIAGVGPEAMGGSLEAFLSEKLETLGEQIQSTLGSLEQTKRELAEQKRLQADFQSRLSQVSEWKLWDAQHRRRLKWGSEIESLQLRLKKARERYVAAETFKELTLEAESLYLQSTLESITAHAQLYLDLFFPDQPIHVRLQTFKQTKKELKPQIHVEVDYKEMESDLSCLSGGELSRVVLAYTVALGEIFNAPLLLLDECTSSLDQELSSVVFQGLKESMGDKLVIVIAHQTITGTFDTCLQTKK